MAKTADSPPFKVRIEGGRLVPATAWDQERLLSFRNGAKLNVRITQERDRPLERKYFAILTRLLKTCGTLWNNVTTAHEALKLALGYVHPMKTVNGSWSFQPRSITSFTDAELEEYFSLVMALIERQFGVNPATLAKEIADIGEDDEHEPSAGSAPSASDAGSGATPRSAAADQSASADPLEPDTDGSGDVSSSVAAPIPFDERAWLRDFARAMVGAIGPEEQVAVNQAKGMFVEGLSDATSKKARSITNYARAACRGDTDKGDAIEMIAGIAGVDPE